MDIDSVLQNKSKKEYNKEEYKAYKKEEKQQIYDLADQTANKTLTSPEMLKTYLDVQARFANYSMNNALLIAAQMPNARMIKSLDEWKKIGAYAKPQCKFITILEPGQKFLKSDNSIYTTFNTKKVIDVSQTTIALGNDTKKYNAEEMFKAFIYKCPYNIEAADELNEGKTVEHNGDTIYIKRGFEETKMFTELSLAFTNAEMNIYSDSSLNDFVSNCSAYMICKSVGIDSELFDLTIPESIKDIDIVDKKNILTQMKNLMDDHINRINVYYKNKEQRNQNYER